MHCGIGGISPDTVPIWSVHGDLCYRRGGISARLHNKWLQKKSSGDALSRKELNARDNSTQDDWLIQEFKDQLQNNRESEKLSSLLKWFSVRPCGMKE